MKTLRVLLLAATCALAQQYTQQGNKLVGSGSVGSPVYEGDSVAISADGNTAVVGGNGDSSDLGAVWIFTRANGAWTQQAKIVPADAAPSPFGAGFGVAVGISSDGNTVIVGGDVDNNIGGSAWIFTRSNGVWKQQGPKLAGNAADTMAGQGYAVAISGDGKTAVVGGPGLVYNNNPQTSQGAIWVFVLTNGVWQQQGTRLDGSNALGLAAQGSSVAVSYDGNTIVEGGPLDNGNLGAAWVFTRSGATWTQQAKLVGTTPSAAKAVSPLNPHAFVTSNVYQGTSVSISGDGSTAIMGGWGDSSNTGAAWVFTRASGAWTHQGKLVGAGASGPADQGFSVGLSSDGNTAILGGDTDAGNAGAAWIFTRSGSTWTQAGNKLVGTGNSGLAKQGWSVALSSDGSTAIVGGSDDNNNIGAAWVYTAPMVVTTPSPTQTNPAFGAGASQIFTFTFTDTGGWQNLTVADVLINNFLDGRHACYIAFVPSTGSVYLVDDAGDAGGPYQGLVLPGSGSISNGQCSVSSASSSFSGNGNTLTLMLNLSFTAAFAGNKVIYMSAGDASANSGWQALGAWQAPTVSTFPTAVSVTPGRGIGQPQPLTFTFSDTKGYQDLGVVNVLINNFLDGRNACYIAYSQPFRVLYLVGDAGGGLSAGLPLGASGSVSNSQCTINSAGSSASGSGANLALVLNMSFTPAFDGNHVIYMAAGDSTDANNSGWQSLGTWTVQ